MEDSEHLKSKRWLATIMFTDMVSFTAITQRDEILAMDPLEEQRRLVRSLVAQHKGREVETIGDAFLIEFVNSLDAVNCAVAIQSALKETNAERPEDKKIWLRIGIHLGDIIHTGTKIAGHAVNIASRIEPLAAPGGICITGQVYASVLSKVEYQFESLGLPVLKNVSTPIEVFRIAGYGQSVGFMPGESGFQKGRVAILPFTNMSPDAADEYFADGMTEEMISSVSKTKGLRVIARTSVMRYKGVSKPIAEIGRELEVGSVLEGSVRKAGDKLRITVQLINTSTEEPQWSQEYDREIRDVFAIQSDIAQKVARALRVHMLGEVSRN